MCEECEYQILEEVMRIPRHLVREIRDDGRVKSMNDATDVDDLYLVAVLSGGTMIDITKKVISFERDYFIISQYVRGDL
jgi:hypothetical protein